MTLDIQCFQDFQGILDLPYLQEGIDQVLAVLLHHARQVDQETPCPLLVQELLHQESQEDQGLQEGLSDLGLQVSPDSHKLRRFLLSDPVVLGSRLGLGCLLNLDIP